MVLLILLGLWFVLQLLLFMNKNRKYWEKRNIVQINTNAWHFLLGNCSLSEVYKNIYDAHPSEDYMGTFVGNKPVLILKNLEDIQTVLQGEFQSFYGRGYNINPQDTLADNLLLIDNYCRWRLLRQNISPVFTGLKLKKLFDTLERCAFDFSKYIEVNNHLEVKFFESLHTYTAASISAAVFGVNSQCENTMTCPVLDNRWNTSDSLLVFNIKMALSNTFPKMFNFLNLKTFGKHEYFVVGIVKKFLRNRSNSKQKRHDLLDTFLKLKNQRILYDKLTGFKLEASDEMLAAQAFSFFIAGVDTSANLINFTLLELSNNPDILKRLHDEIDAVFDNCQEKITYDDIQRMEYMEMIVNEAMRKYPPIGLMQRMCMKDTVLPSRNIKIYKNDIIIVPIYALHNDNKYFTDPKIFDPERFSPQNASKIVKFSYMPFGEGYRNCIGARFANLQIKTALAWLLRRYTLKGYSYKSKCFEPSFFGIRDSKARYDLIPRSEDTQILRLRTNE